MDTSTDNKDWVEHWTRVGPILQRVRRDELRAMTDAQAASDCISLFEFAAGQPYGEDQQAIGLVEQQRLFLKSRKS